MANSFDAFRVIIVGGGIAGLTLALSLERHGIQYLLLESRNAASLQRGSTLGIFPNGSKILEQLKILKHLLTAEHPAEASYVWTEDGQLLSQRAFLQMLNERLGYPVFFLQRARLIQALYKCLGHRNKRVLLNKKVLTIQHTKSCVRVHCTDGSSFVGSIVVGADGVHSTVRQSMWNHIGKDYQLNEVVDKEKSRLSTEYTCVFGQSDAICDIEPGSIHTTYGTEFSILTVRNLSGIYWCLFTRLGSQSQFPNATRLKKEDLTEHLKFYATKCITNKVPFSALLESATEVHHFPLEEAFYTVWCWDRFVCIGDSVHKMSPNLGQGANSAMESAVSLANCLSQMLLLAGPEPEMREIHKHFTQWASHRQPRMKRIWEKAHRLIRFETLSSYKDSILAWYVLPWVDHYMSTSFCDMVANGEVLYCSTSLLGKPPGIIGSLNYNTSLLAWKRWIKTVFLYILAVLTYLIVVFYTI